MRARGLVAALACALVLAGCGGPDYPVEEGTSPLTVQVGEEFSWNGFHVEDGWTLAAVERDIGMQETQTSPEVKGSVVNERDDARAVLFEMTFAAEGDALATVKCSAMELTQGQSSGFECPGFGQPMPSDYDTVVVQEITR